MTPEETVTCWRGHYGALPPSQYQLLGTKSIGWVRFHYLPDAGWCTGKPADRHNARRRCRLLSDHVFGDEVCVVFHSQPGRDIRLTRLTFEPLPALDWDHIEYEAHEVPVRRWFNRALYAHAGFRWKEKVEVASGRWSLDLFTELFDDPDRWYTYEPNYLVLAPRSGIALGFYHSGVDVFSPKPEGVLNVARRFRRWLPPPPYYS